MRFASDIFECSIIGQKIGYDKAAACAKKAHKEGTTLKARSRVSYCALQSTKFIYACCCFRDIGVYFEKPGVSTFYE